mgnify:CR=1 FL=1
MKKLLTTLLIFSVVGLINAPAMAETVVFNTNTYKYHKPTCKWAKKCTKNCIKIEKKKAQQRGGVPCKVCGG